MENKPNYYAILTAEVRYDNRLNANQKLLYAELTALANTHGYAWPSNEYLANLYGVSDKTISRNIQRLKELKYIKVIEQKSGTGTVRKIYINSENNPLDKNVPSEHNPLDKNVHTPLDKNVPSYSYSNNTRDLILQDSYKREIDNNISNREIDINDNKITLSLCLKIGNRLKINKTIIEKFYYYFSSNNFTTKSNVKITLDNLENQIQLWNLRELDNSSNVNKINKPDWLNKYLDELKDMEIDRHD